MSNHNRHGFSAVMYRAFGLMLIMLGAMVGWMAYGYDSSMTQDAGYILAAVCFVLGGLLMAIA